MAKKAKLTVKIDGDDSGLKRALTSARAGVNAFGNAAVMGMKAVAAAAGVASVALAVGVKHALDLGGELVDLSAKTGIAADQLLILQQAGKDAGLEDVTGAVNKMQVALVDSVRNGTGPAAKALDLLRLRGEDLIRKSPVEQIEAIGDALRGIQNPALRSDIVGKLFGKGNQDIKSLVMNPGAMKEAAESIGKQAQLLKQNAEAFDAVSDRLNRSGLKLQGFFVGVASGIVKQLDEATSKFDKLDLAEQGERFGAALAPVLDKLLKVDFGAMMDATIAKAKTLQTIMGWIGKANDIITGGGLGFGAKVIKDFIAPPVQRTDNALVQQPSYARPPAPPAPKPKPFIPLGTSLGSTGGLQAGGLANGQGYFESQATGFTQGGMMGGFKSSSSLSLPAYKQTQLLSVGERRRAENATVAAGGDRDARRSNASAYGVVRRGDSNRLENEAKRKEREENTLKATNAKLESIVTNTKDTADALKPVKSN